ncbi:protease inhibitor I42 family protein [Bacillus cereus]|uniref:Proteinase inhibitor I42 chagasin domain-containing protein n=2 Tax=Bacillus cereus group TaxID=86661 RepID=A0A9W5KRC2_BACCE|nr:MULTISPECIES: protease inhibitor I42 family protein [Bacillus cereus group]MEB8748715.1 protease inhibitor I42 family protein [Bacillus cereus]EEM44772.1 hypothetical protein bthur0005_53980 [Bacillus thuringiensis serovar pakistani str. T13001]EJR64004.1 hypothetical protein IK5_05790 [Bacillus cereus VD154]KIU74535.1 hypothetical protein C797_12231 [Bacillus thuringiensis Sbt003]MEB8759294.1 protease inhibitor I42 family protein [Bacillus cereus]
MGEHIHISTGQFLSLSLAENPTTRYRWTTTNINYQISLVGEFFQPNNIGDGTVGKPGIHKFQVKAIEPGVTKLQLKKWRSWEGDSSIIDTFYVWVHVGSDAKTVGFEKKKKLPSGIELYAVKPKLHE